MVAGAKAPAERGSGTIHKIKIISKNYCATYPTSI